MRHRVSLAFLAAGLMAVGAFAAKPLEHLTAFAVDMSNLADHTRTGTVDIEINRWSTPQERDMLVAALGEGGTGGLLRALQKIKKPAGYIRNPGSVGCSSTCGWARRGRARASCCRSPRST